MRLRPLLFPLCLAFLAMWSGIVFTLLYHQAFSGDDDWAYFSPAVFAKGPGKLSMTLLGDFEGFDHIWGMHWPGFLLFESTFIPHLPKSPVVWTTYKLALWTTIAFFAAVWMKRNLAGRSPRIPLLVFILILLDRILFDIAGIGRSEFCALLVLLGALWGIWRQVGNPAPFSSPDRGMKSSALFFSLLPLVHPTSMIGGGLLIAVLALGRIWSRRPSWRYLTTIAGAFGLGVGAFALYFAIHPGAWNILVENATINVSTTYTKGHQYFGHSLERIARIPSYACELLVLALALIFSLFGGARTWSNFRREGKWSPELLVILFFSITFVLAQSTYNPSYLAIPAVFAVMVIGFGLAGWQTRFTFLPAAVMALLCCLQSTYLAAKLDNARRAGWPNPHAAMLSLRDSFPSSARLILLPTVMWEVAAIHPGPFAMNTLLYTQSEERKRQYEEPLYARMQRGDLLLINRFQDSKPVYQINPAAWEKIAEKKCLYTRSGKETGFDITVWQKK